MVDTLGWRCKFGIVTPSTNTVVQPEYEAMRPRGVTNHIARMHIPDDPIKSDGDFDELIRRIDVALEEAVDRVVTCRPDHIILGISAESIWGGGLEASRKIHQRISSRSGGTTKVTQAAEALPAALRAFGITTVAMITPYFPVAERHLRVFADEVGLTIKRFKNFSCTSPVQIGHVTADQLRDAIKEVDGDDVQGIMQFGANLAMGAVAAEAERWIGKPVIAVNTATYWHALRSHGIADKIYGCGQLLERF